MDKTEEEEQDRLEDEMHEKDLVEATAMLLRLRVCHAYFCPKNTENIVFISEEDWNESIREDSGGGCSAWDFGPDLWKDLENQVIGIPFTEAYGQVVPKPLVIKSIKRGKLDEAWKRVSPHLKQIAERQENPGDGVIVVWEEAK